MAGSERFVKITVIPAEQRLPGSVFEPDLRAERFAVFNTVRQGQFGVQAGQELPPCGEALAIAVSAALRHRRIKTMSRNEVE